MSNTCNPCRLGCRPIFFIQKSTRSSFYTTTYASKIVFQTENQRLNNQGNKVKRGSGGNSYNTFIKNKVGSINLCSC